MSDWHTLHIFSDTIFYNHVIPSLRGEKEDLLPIYRKHMPWYMFGSYNLPEPEQDAAARQALQSIRDIAHEFDSTFRIHRDSASQTKDDYPIPFGNQNKYIPFYQFFISYLFQTCVDLYPHLAFGRGGVNSAIDSTTSTGNAMLSMLHPGGPKWFFQFPDYGTVGWLTAEETELLYYDKQNLSSERRGDEFIADFSTLLKVAVENKLGLLYTEHINEDFLAQFSGFKLVSKDRWAREQSQGCFIVPTEKGPDYKWF